MLLILYYFIFNNIREYKKWAIEQGEWDPSKPNWQEFNNRDKNSSYLFDHTNGSGPFIVERWDRAAKRVYLSANKNYFLGAPKLDSVLVLSVPEQSTMRLMLESGDADIAEIAGSFVDQISSNPNIIVYDTLPRLKTDPVLFFIPLEESTREGKNGRKETFLPRL